MPASGVLKAAAMPAADPARISPRACAMPPQRAACSISEAPTCTVGPSRPIDAPDARPTTVSRILPTTSFSDRMWLRSASSRSTRAAMACGMPLPCDPGNQLCAIQAQRTKPAGVMTSGSADCQPPGSVTWWNSDCAASDRWANSTLISPMPMAPAQNTIRGCHTRRDVHMTRDRRSTGKLFSIPTNLSASCTDGFIKVFRRRVSTVERDAPPASCYVRAKRRQSDPIHPYSAES